MDKVGGNLPPNGLPTTTPNEQYSLWHRANFLSRTRGVVFSVWVALIMGAVLRASCAFDSSPTLGGRGGGGLMGTDVHET